MKFGLIWRALIRSGHVLTFWIMNALCAGNQYMHACARAHTQPARHLYTTYAKHTGTDRHTIAQREDGQNPRTQGGFFNDASWLCLPPFSSRLPLFLPPLSFVWPTERCILTGTVVCIQQTWDETHPRGEGWLCVLCNALVKVSLSLHLSIPPSFSSFAAAGQRCISQGHDAGSVLLTGPASGRWTHSLTHTYTQSFILDTLIKSVVVF